MYEAYSTAEYGESISHWVKTAWHAAAARKLDSNFQACLQMMEDITTHNNNPVKTYTLT